MTRAPPSPSGVRRSRVCWYFDSKDALYQALVERDEQALWAHVGSAVSSSGDEDPERTLIRGVRAAFEFFADDPAAARLLSFDRFTDDVERLIADAQRRGTVIDAPPRVLALSVTAVISTIASQATSDPGFDTEATAEVVVSLLLDGLRRRHP